MNRTIEGHLQTQSSKKYPFDVDAYSQHTKKTRISQHSRKSHDTSLPIINPFAQSNSKVKINVIRKQAGQTQQQIALTKARIHALGQMKNKLQLKKQKSLQKIQFLHTIRERINFQSTQKIKQKQKQQRQRDELKQKAKQLRQGMRKQILKARQTLYMKNQQMANIQKNMQTNNQSQIAIKIKKQIQQKQLKKQKIKQQQQKHNQKIKQFQQSRIKFASQNHLTKAEKQLRQKQRKEKSLQKLKQQQNKWVEEVKRLQKQYQQTREKLNPEISNIKSSRLSMKYGRSEHPSIKRINLYDI